MPTFTSTNFGKHKMSPHSAGELMVLDDVVSLPITLAKDDVAKIGHLPAGCVPVDCLVYTEELDAHATAATLKFDVGILDDAGTALASGTALITDGDASADKVVRGNGAGLAGIAPNDTTDRVIGVVITAAGATKAAGDMRVKVTYRASNFGA